jgi:hypothetical protein
MKLFHLSLSLALLTSPLCAGAGEFWRFETDEGVVSFVDDAKKIPEKYRAQAVKHESEGLDSYARATVAGPAPAAPAPAAAAAAAGAALAVPTLAEGPVMRVPDIVDRDPDHVRSKEFRWVDGAFGAPGEVYALVEVVRDSDGEIVSIDLHDPDTRHIVSDH